ncbi:MAG: GGDEF domain-containing protein [Pseudomonadota bacterium]|nr:GGDEF domain-containing protein [Pseudomonadota bacterium]
MRRTDRTLLEQMRVSDVEIQNRMDLLGLTFEALEQLYGMKEFIESRIDLIVDEFYDRQTSIDEISLLIGDADTLQRLRTAQRNYIVDLFSGRYDREYVNNRLRIGMVHKRIGVEPKLYLSAVRSLKELLIQQLDTAIEDRQRFRFLAETLDRLIYFDTTLVFDTYIDSLVGEIETAQKRTEIYAKSLEEKVAQRTRQLEDQAKRDPLTELYNKRAMHEMLAREIAVAKRRQTPLSMIYIDVDCFKEINDKYGHVKGDEVLKNLACCLRANIREVDIPCRYGGDEFCVILPDCHLGNAELLGQRIVEACSECGPACSLSVGLAQTGPEQFVTGDELIRLADDKMYSAKRDGGLKIRC